MKPEASRPRTEALLIGIAVALGAGLRTWALVRDGGARTAAMVYDDGVYVAAGALLRDGHLPFRDFVFVQPPGITYLVAFASFIWRDPEQLLVAMRYAAIVAGIVNLWLVAVIMRRYVGIVEAIVSTLVYAVLPEAVYAEHTVVLEPWLNLACLSAVYLWLSVDRTAEWRRFGPRGRARGAGMLLALALTFKVWAIFCIVACVIAAPRRARRARLADLGVGTALGVAVLWLPLLVVAPSEAVDQVVRFQLGRPADGIDGPFSRLWRMAKPAEITDAGWWRATFALVLVGCGIFVAMRAATRLARLTVAWFALTIVGFLVASTWWEQYSAHAAVAFALLSGFAAHGIVTSLRSPSGKGATIARLGIPVAAIVLLSGYVVDSLRYEAEHTSVVVDAARDIERFVPSGDCVVALEPGWLVMAGRLPQTGQGHRATVDPYAALLLDDIVAGSSSERDLAEAIDACRYLVVSDFRLSMLSPELRRSIETGFVTRSNPDAGIRVLERR
jgi:hypothetical protein